MKILAMDLSTARASLVFFDGGGTAGLEPMATDECVWPNDRKNSGPFFENLERTIREFGLPQKIVVGLGPGSYAGIRIAVSAAIGLEVAARADLVGYPSVCAMPDQAGDYIVIGDARRHSFFFVRVKNRAVAGEYELLSEEELWHRIDQHPGVRILSSDFPPQLQPRVEQAYPSAEILGQLAGEKRLSFVGSPLEPIYLREANVTVPKPMMRGPN